MRVHLRDLKPNPMRDFTVDPIDNDAVAALTASMKEYDFWGGVTARKNKDGSIQIAAGHHRVKAAIKAGYDEADIFVSREWDDATMLRIYAEENATQRGSTSTAVAGSVAAALKYLAKHGGDDTAGNPAALNKTNAHGIGWSQIVDFLDGVPGVNKNTVVEQLANLKASGDYERILREAQKEIEKENAAALAELKRQEAEAARIQKEAEEAEQRRKEAEAQRKEAEANARKAKQDAERKRAEAEAQRAELERQKQEQLAKAAAKRKAEADKELEKFAALKTKRDVAATLVRKEEERSEREGGPTFDFEGVARYLKTASHVSVFRELAQGQGAKRFLPVKNQAAFAKHLVDLCGKGEMSGKFIREKFMSELLNARTAQGRIDKDEREAALRDDWKRKAEIYQEDAARQARGFLKACLDLASHDKERPKGVTLHVKGEFRTAIKNINSAMSHLEKIGLV